MKYIKTLFVALIVVVFGVIYVQNQDLFTHQFRLVFDISVFKMGPYLVYNVALIGIAFLIGVVFSVLYGVFHTSGKPSGDRKKDERIRQLENEISELENKLSESEKDKEKNTGGAGLFSPPSGSQ